MSITIVRVQFREPVHFAGKSMNSCDFAEKDRAYKGSKVTGGVHIICETKPAAGVCFVPDANIVSMTFTPAEESKAAKK